MRRLHGHPRWQTAAIAFSVFATAAMAQVYPSYGPSVQISSDTGPDSSAAPTPPLAQPVSSVSVDYGRQSRRPLTGFLAFPMQARGTLPGVILCPDGWGLTPQFRALAQSIARHGYTVLAVDPYDNRIASTAAAAAELAAAAAKNPSALDDNLRQAYAYLKSRLHTGRMAVMGFDTGSGLALRADRILPGRIAAVVAYTPRISALDDAPANGPLLVVTGAARETLPPASLQTSGATMKQSERTVEWQVYPGAGDDFANPLDASYSAATAREALARSLGFLAAHLGPQSPVRRIGDRR